MKPLSLEIIESYNNIRTVSDKSVICHAPFININFDQYGNMTACCYNRSEKFGTYPKDTIIQAWNGEAIIKLRNSLLENSLEGGCSLCKELIMGRNFTGSRAMAFDKYLHNSNKNISNLINYPRIMEFELANTCNLECSMCNGNFSSTIRKNRERKPPLLSPYDKEFLNQLNVSER